MQSYMSNLSHSSWHTTLTDKTEYQQHNSRGTLIVSANNDAPRGLLRAFLGGGWRWGPDFRQWYRRQHHQWHLLVVCFELVVMVMVSRAINRRYLNYMESCANLGQCISIHGGLMSDQEVLDLSNLLESHALLGCHQQHGLHGHAGSGSNITYIDKLILGSCQHQQGGSLSSPSGDMNMDMDMGTSSTRSKADRPRVHGQSHQSPQSQLQPLGASVSAAFSALQGSKSQWLSEISPLTTLRNGDLSLLGHQLQLLVTAVLMWLVPE